MVQLFLSTQELAGEMWSFKESVIVFVDNEPIGGKSAFMKWAEGNFDFRDLRPLPLWYAMAKESYKNYLLSTKVCPVQFIPASSYQTLSGFLSVFLVC